MKNLYKISFLLLAILFIISCGGGGSKDDTSNQASENTKHTISNATLVDANGQVAQEDKNGVYSFKSSPTYPVSIKRSKTTYIDKNEDNIQNKNEPSITQELISCSNIKTSSSTYTNDNSSCKNEALNFELRELRSDVNIKDIKFVLIGRIVKVNPPKDEPKTPTNPTKPSTGGGSTARSFNFDGTWDGVEEYIEVKNLVGNCDYKAKFVGKYTDTSYKGSTVTMKDEILSGESIKVTSRMMPNSPRECTVERNSNIDKGVMSVSIPIQAFDKEVCSNYPSYQLGVGGVKVTRKFCYKINTISDDKFEIVRSNEETGSDGKLYTYDKSKLTYTRRGSTTPTKPTTSKTRVLKTGQTKSYATGDDGYYQKGIARSYTRSGDIVIDNATKFQWQDDIDAKTVFKNVEDAKTYCSGLTLGGYSDWRLPSIRELKTIVDRGKATSPVIDPTFKNVRLSIYWSSTPYAPTTTSEWLLVSFSYGEDLIIDKSENWFVRCVRDGQ